MPAIGSEKKHGFTFRPIIGTNVGKSLSRLSERLMQDERYLQTWINTWGVDTNADTVWHEIGASGEPAFENSWTNFGSGFATAAYRRYPDNILRLKGNIKLGTNNTRAFYLPVGWRPAVAHTLATASSHNGGNDRIDVWSDGQVIIRLAGTTPSWCSIECSFPLDD